MTALTFYEDLKAFKPSVIKQLISNAIFSSRLSKHVKVLDQVHVTFVCLIGYYEKSGGPRQKVEQ